MDIKFGTDGWRGVMARDFTFDNVRKVSQAIAEYIKNLPPKQRNGGKVVIGYDRRFLSREIGAPVRGRWRREAVRSGLRPLTGSCRSIHVRARSSRIDSSGASTPTRRAVSASTTSTSVREQSGSPMLLKRSRGFPRVEAM